MEDKFRWAAGFVLDKPQIDALVEMIWRFEQVTTVKDLMATLLEE